MINEMGILERKWRKPGLRLVAFDMDGVLAKNTSSWSYIHHAFNVKNDKNLQAYVRGEIDYEGFMKKDIGLWVDVQDARAKIVDLLNMAPLMGGAPETVMELKNMGYRTAIISAGLLILAERLKTELGIDRILANDLKVDGSGNLTGEGIKAVELKDKRPALKQLARLEKIPRRSMAYVGDSAFDVPLFGKVGKSIAFNPSSPIVAGAADVAVYGDDLRRILRHLA